MLGEDAIPERIVGVVTSSDYLKEVKRAERVGWWIKPNIEKIIALQPDIVLATALAGQQSAVKTGAFIQITGIRHF